MHDGSVGDESVKTRTEASGRGDGSVVGRKHPNMGTKASKGGATEASVRGVESDRTEASW